MKLEAFKEKYMYAIEQECRRPFRLENTKLKEAMGYALSTGGKHVRPLLTLAFTQALGGNFDTALRFSPAIEYVHTYSLIHDDLPAMDNDDYRRGELSVHKKYDEATAILAGDALLTYAFQYISDVKDITSENKVQLIHMLAEASGPDGMVEGQMQDIMLEGTTIARDQLEALHHYKTGELISFSILSAAILAEASEKIQQQCLEFATHYGVAYQIHNDLQEVLWTDEERGKQANSDADLEKNTYPGILGVEGAKEALSEKIKACRHCLGSIAEEYPDFDLELVKGFLDYVAL